jgi:hypothetical protein
MVAKATTEMASAGFRPFALGRAGLTVRRPATKSEEATMNTAQLGRKVRKLVTWLLST